MLSMFADTSMLARRECVMDANLKAMLAQALLVIITLL